jgi:hypothetical protein
MSSVTEQFGKDLNAYKKKKDDEVTDVAEANRSFAESLAKMPSSFNDKWNTFFGDTSNNAMKGATQVTDDFNNGVIDKRTFDIRMANLNSSVSMTVESMTKIAAEINKYEELSAAGKMNAEDQYKWSKLQKFADLGNVSMVFDPEAYTSTLIKVNPPDIAKGTSSSYDMMNINQFYNGVNMTPGPMYDTNAAITNTLNSLGGVRDITTSEGKREAGIILEGAEGDKVVSDLAQSMLGQSRDMRLFAMDNTITDEEGKVADFDYAAIPMDVYDAGGSINQEKFKKLQTDNPYIFYEDQSGRFYESDKGKEVILKNAEQMLRGAADYTKVEAKKISNFDDNIQTILDLTLIAQRSGQIIDKEALGILLAGAKGGLDFEALSSALGSGMFTDAPVKISATELKNQLDNEKALRDAIKIDEAKAYLKKNLFTVDGAFVNPADGDEYTDAEIETLLTPLGLNIQKDGDNVIVYDGNTAVLNLGKGVTKERIELLKTALIAGSEDMIYSIFRRSNPEYTYKGDVEVEEEQFILDPD